MNMVPDGYMKNSQGALIPVDNVKPEHKLEDELARRLVGGARSINTVLAEFKATVLSEVEAFRELVMEQYGVTRGGAKGNVTLSSYDGELRVQVAISEYLTFGPELEAAKALIDGCIERWSEGANDNIRVLVNDAFQVNKEGRIDTHRVLGLRRLKIEDADWQRAMQAIGDAVRVTGSKTYARFYERDPKSGETRPIPLDLAAV